MNTLKLRYFIAVANSGSFSSAAQTLGIAQSALSRHVADLETLIGGKLFERTGRGVSLSPVGRMLLEDADRLLAQFDRTFDQLRAAATSSSRRLTIGLNALTMRFPSVLQAIAAFVKNYPDVDLQIPVMRSVTMIALLRDQRIDAGFLMEPTPGLPDLNRYHVGYDGFRAALSKNHPLAAKPVLSLSDLEGAPCILISAQNLWRPQSKILQQCNSYGFRPNVRMEVLSQHLQLELIDREVGYGFVNASAQAVMPRNVVLRRVVELRDRLELEFVFLRSRGNPLIQAFRQELAKAIEYAEAQA